MRVLPPPFGRTSTGTVTLTVEWKDGRIIEEVRVVDLSVVNSVRLDFDFSRPLVACRADAIYEYGYSRDVTADPGTVWSSSNSEIICFDADVPGLLHGVSDGGATIAFTFAGFTDMRKLDSQGGVIAYLGNIGASGRDFLVRGIATCLEIDLHRFTDSVLRNDEGVAVRAMPPDAIEFALYEKCWYMTGLRPGIVVVEARCGALSVRREFEIRNLAVTLSRIEARGGNSYTSEGVLYLWLNYEAEVSTQLCFGGDRSLDAAHNVRWTSSAPGILELVNTNGIMSIRGHREGETILRAECLDQVAELAVRVMERPEIQWF